MIVAVIDSAQVSKLSSQEVWEAGLEIGALPPYPACRQRSSAPGCRVCTSRRGLGRKAAPERQVGLAAPQGFPFSIFFGHFCSTGKVKGLVFALNRPSTYLTQDDMVTPFLCDLSTVHMSPSFS